MTAPLLGPVPQVTDQGLKEPVWANWLGVLWSIISQGNFRFLTGTTTNDSAPAGAIGEYISGTSGGGIASGTAFNAALISLTPGDWDVSGVVGFSPSGAAVIATEYSSVSLFSTTLGSLGQTTTRVGPIATGVGDTLPTPTVRVSLAATGNVYLTGLASFSGGTCSVTGFIRARRVR